MAKQSGVAIVWKDAAAKKKILDLMEGRMWGAAAIIHEAIVAKINVGQPVKRYASGRLKGLAPSSPGDPPKTLSGRLKQSFEIEVIRKTSSVIGRVGTDVEYDPRLEFGFVGTDAAGRKVSQEPRPHVKPAFDETKRLAAKALVGKLV